MDDYVLVSCLAQLACMHAYTLYAYTRLVIHHAHLDQYSYLT